MGKASAFESHNESAVVNNVDNGFDSVNKTYPRFAIPESMP